MGSDLNPPCDGRAGGDLSKPPGPSLSANLEVPSWTLSMLRAIMRNKSERGRPQDVVVWLRSLGLGKYEAARSQREIDVSYRKSGRPLGTARDARRA